MAEVYWRFVLNDYFAAAADVQYMKDNYTSAYSALDNPAGWIFGLRFTAEF